MIKVQNLYIKEINSLINCEFKDGINYLEGKNGSGKTLLLDYIGELRSPSLQKGKIVNGTSKIYMRQSFTFYNRLTVSEYIRFIQELSGEKIDCFQLFLQTYYPTLDFEQYKKSKLGLLSGGERRLVYILSILSVKKNWYILDEPFSNLDQEKKEALIEIIEKMCQQQKANFIITAHEPFNFDSLNIVNFDSILKKDKSR